MFHFVCAVIGLFGISQPVEASSGNIITTNNGNIICYFPNWATGRGDVWKYDISNINPELCTHIIYSFVTFELDYFRQPTKLTWTRNDDFARYKELYALKTKNPALQISVALGGASHLDEAFERLVNNETNREVFANNTVTFLETHKFDGLDIDWEFPTERARTNFTMFLKVVYDRLDKRGFKLSAAMSAWRDQANRSYEIGEVFKYLHFVNFMAYDLQGSWHNYTAIHSALRRGPFDDPFNRSLTIEDGIQFYIEQGADPRKIHLGIPFYGRSFDLNDRYQIGIGAPSFGPGIEGEITNEAGILAYYEICRKLSPRGNWFEYYDDTVEGAYAVNQDTNWVGYDNERSIRAKINFTKEYNLGGIMIWDISMDDFVGVCGKPYPLLTTINEELKDITYNYTVPENLKRCNYSSTQRVNLNQNAEQVEAYKSFCYYPNWAYSRGNGWRFTPVQMEEPLSHCTHIVFAYAHLQLDDDHRPTKVAHTEWDDQATYQSILNFKDEYPGLKFIIALGGEQADNRYFTEMTQDEYHRELFIKRLINFIIQNGFDGVSVDWFYPTVDESQEYTELLKNVKKEFDRMKDATGRIFELIVSLPGRCGLWDGYNITEIFKHIDYANIMGYNLYDPSSGTTGIHCGLYPNDEVDDEIARTLTVHSAVQYYLNHGAIPSKILMGIPSYGVSFRLDNVLHTLPGDRAKGPGEAGQTTQEPGVMAYFEICDTEGWEIRWDDSRKAPYAVNADGDWIGYDDRISVLEKVNYVKNWTLRGVVLFDMSQDDFRGVCHTGYNPLLDVISVELKTDNLSPVVYPTITAVDEANMETVSLVLMACMLAMSLFASKLSS